MTPHASPGKVHWLPVLGAVALAAGAAAALRGAGAPRTAAEKLRVVTAYQDAGDEACSVCFARIGAAEVPAQRRLYARTPSQERSAGYWTIYVCGRHRWPLEAGARARALANWKAVRVEWVREHVRRAIRVERPYERAVREFEGARLVTPEFLDGAELP